MFAKWRIFEVGIREVDSNIKIKLMEKVKRKALNIGKQRFSCTFELDV